MSRALLVSLIVLLMAGSGIAFAARPATDGTTSARLRALEKRLSELEQKQAESTPSALEKRVSALEQKMNGSESTAGTVKPDGSLEQRVSSLEKKRPVARPLAPLAPVGPPRWKKHSSWASLKIGMTWSQVKETLGVPGKVQAGVFGDVMYFPDGNGGKVEFDRDGRVSSWSESGKDE